jgi:hypothetical protein
VSGRGLFVLTGYRMWNIGRGVDGVEPVYAVGAR